MTKVDRRISHYGTLGGAIQRMNATFFRGKTEWEQVFRMLAAVLIALGTAYGVGLTGGLVTVIAVLFMAVLPHSPQLAVLRFASAIIGFGAGWLFAFQFVDQPWLLIAGLWANAFFWFYMMATGLPFLTMLMLGLIPILVGWMVYAGKDAYDVYFALGQYLCGLFGAEVVSLLWPNSAVRSIKKSAAGALRQFSAQIRSGFGEERPGRTRVGESNWEPSQSLGFNRLLMLARSEVGAQSREFRGTAGLVENIRHLVAWPKVYSSFVHSGRFDKWMIDLMDERERVHEESYKSMEEVANALESGRPAEDQTHLEDAFKALDDHSREWLRAHKDELSLETISLVEARCHYCEVVVYRINEIIKFTRGEFSTEEDSAGDLPEALISNFTQMFDPKAGLFAAKSVLCVFVGFVVASIFPQWGGSLIILLISGFLAPLTLGGLTVNFVDRLWGLFLSAVVCVVVITVLMPNLVQVGELLLIVAVVLLPGAILALKPKTASMGLSYAMGMLFILTSSNHPSASLEPVQERLIGVGGATLICYLVFRWISPSKASDLVTARIKDVFTSIADLIRSSKLMEGDFEDLQWSLKQKRHAAIRTCGAYDQFVDDLEWESGAPDGVAQMRRHMVELLNAHLLIAGTNSVLSLNRELMVEKEICKAMNATIDALADVELQLAEVVGSFQGSNLMDTLRHRIGERMAYEREALLQANVMEHVGNDDARARAVRVLLTKYAHHCKLCRYQQKLYRALQVRDMLHDTVRAEFFGRTT